MPCGDEKAWLEADFEVVGNVHARGYYDGVVPTHIMQLLAAEIPSVYAA